MLGLSVKVVLNPVAKQHLEFGLWHIVHVDGKSQFLELLLGHGAIEAKLVR
jgi:hypothetical protein